MKNKDKLIFALDVDNLEEVEKWVLTLRDYVGVFKIGKELFTKCGPKAVERVLSLGSKVFLDLKFHDIPSTVAKAGIQAAKLGVSIFNVHALGGREMMVKAAEAVKKECMRADVKPPLIVAVTVLTSLSENDLKELGIMKDLSDEVIHLAKLVKDSGLGGVVCSPKEITLIKDKCGNDFKVITPGIRAKDALPDDQKRTLTPSEAISLGADFIVVGRPIRLAPNPVMAAKEILDEISLAS